MKKIFFYAMSIGIPFIICSLVFYSLDIAPFGHQTFLVSDIGSQYLQFLNFFHSFFTDHLSLYSFSNGIGDSVLALAGYYLTSPFNLISLFFNESNMPVVLSLLILLKISVMGFSMSFYLSKHHKKLDYSILLFSTAYSFCGFVIAYSMNYMWLDALILLPFVVLGLERLWLQNRPTLYAVSLCLTIVTNYYLGYMVCLFSVLYSIYLYALQYEKREDFKIAILFKRGKTFILYSLLAGLTSSFVLIPSILGMMNTAKTSFSIISLLPYPKFFISVFSQLGIGTIRYDLRLDHLPTLYSGIFIVIFFIVYFLITGISKREKVASFYLLVALFATLIIELFNTIWHMFQSPAGFPYRQTFIFSFLIIIFSYKGFLVWRKSCEKSYLFKAAGLFIGFLFIGEIGLGFQNIFFKNKSFFETQQLESLALSLAFIIIYVILLLLWSRKKAVWIFTCITILVCFELGLNYRFGLQDVPFGNQTTYSSFSKKINATVTDLNPDHNLFRVQNKLSGSALGYHTTYNAYNDAWTFQFAGTSAYTSTLNEKTLDTLTNLGIYSKNERRFNYVDTNPVINLLLNVKYQLSYENGQLMTQQNKEAIGSGFFMQNDQIKLRDGAVFSNIEAVLQGILPSKKPYLVKMGANDETQAEGNLLLYAPNTEWTKTDAIFVNGQKHQTHVAILSNQLFNLGYFKKGEHVEIKFKPDDLMQAKKPDFYTLSNARFQHLLQHLQTNALTLTEGKGDYLSGTVNTPNETNKLFLSIPFDEAWQVKIDGKPVPKSQVMGNFIGISVPKGKHAITLSYYPKVVPFSLLLSTAALLTGIVIRRRK